MVKEKAGSKESSASHSSSHKENKNKALSPAEKKSEIKKELAGRKYKFVYKSGDYKVAVFSDLKLDYYDSEVKRIDRKKFQDDAMTFTDPVSDVKVDRFDTDRNVKYIDRTTAFIDVEELEGGVKITEYNKELEPLKQDIYIFDNNASQNANLYPKSNYTEESLTKDILERRSKSNLGQYNMDEKLAKEYNLEDIRSLAKVVGAKSDSDLAKTINNIRKKLLEKENSSTMKLFRTDSVDHARSDVEKFTKEYDLASTENQKEKMMTDMVVETNKIHTQLNNKKTSESEKKKLLEIYTIYNNAIEEIGSQ